MDNVTHALAGALMAAGTCAVVARRNGEPSTTFRRAAFTLGVVLAELPDSDLAYSGRIMGVEKLGYLLHHRGHTHTVLFVIASAVIAWGITLGMRRELRARELSRPLLALSLIASISHIALDWTNSYGVHPFWPVDNRWYYGDAVFIVEPWFWVLSLPPLFFAARSVVTRALCAILLLVIVLAAWRVDMVAPAVAAVLTGVALFWTVLVRSATPGRRAMLGIVAWLVMEGVFLGTSSVGRIVVRRSVGPAYRDVALTPAPGNPLCHSAIVVREERGVYHVTTATVAPISAIVDATGCHGRGRPAETGGALLRSDATIVWGTDWSAPASELREIAARNCEVSAALRFMRVPEWRRASGSEVLVFDRRFSGGAGDEGFASIVAQGDAPCPRYVPSWEWPRRDVFGSAP